MFLIALVGEDRFQYILVLSCLEAMQRLAVLGNGVSNLNHALSFILVLGLGLDSAALQDLG